MSIVTVDVPEATEESFTAWLNEAFSSRSLLWANPIRLGPTKAHVYGFDRKSKKQFMAEVANRRVVVFASPRQFADRVAQTIAASLADCGGAQPSRECLAHGYAGFPPCPVPDCPNGHDRSLFVAYTVAGFGDGGADYDNLHLGEGRYFHRERRGGVYQWIELAPTGNVYEANR